MSTGTMLEQLRAMRLHGMAKALEQQDMQPTFADTSFEDRFQMCINIESQHREIARYKRILQKAKLKEIVAPEEFEHRSSRGITKKAYNELATCNWIAKYQNVLITGATGTGKTWIACSLAVAAARQGVTSSYRRLGRLLEEMALAHEDGSINKLRAQLYKTELLILDDFGLTALTQQGRTDLLELLDDRVGRASTMVLGQMPVKEWHSFINEPALADAILDRLVHTSTKLLLEGESMRKLKSKVGSSDREVD